MSPATWYACYLGTAAVALLAFGHGHLDIGDVGYLTGAAVSWPLGYCFQRPRRASP